LAPQWPSSQAHKGRHQGSEQYSQHNFYHKV
jgi:hypothetical protein